jgi:hypothetical protein
MPDLGSEDNDSICSTKICFLKMRTTECDVGFRHITAIRQWTFRPKLIQSLAELTEAVILQQGSINRHCRLGALGGPRAIHHETRRRLHRRPERYFPR